MRIESSLNLHWRAALAFGLHRISLSLSFDSVIQRQLPVMHFTVARSAIDSKRIKSIIRKHKRKLWFYIDLQTPLTDRTAGKHASGNLSVKIPFLLIYGNVSTQLAAKFRQIWEDTFGKLLEFSISAFLDRQSRCRRF